MEDDLAPLGGAIDDEDDVANLDGFEGGAGDAGFLDELGDVEESRKIEAAAYAAELADLGGELLLGLNPGVVGGWGESGNARLA
jgi:hypothetical protein